MTSAPHPPANGDLASRQAALIAALVAGAELPAGFDPARVSAARRALLVKRAGEVATVWPLLAASFGTGWSERFIAWAQDRAPVGSLREGWDFARALDGRGELPELAAAELTEREARWHYDGRHPPRRRRLRRRTLPAPGRS
ncbi:MAG: hypothetical protein ACRDSH_01115 [Pseudonocardiaceae bacterium]